MFIKLYVINIIIHFCQTFDVFKFISRGFYEQHKYLFTMLLTLKIDLQREYITFEEFQSLIKGFENSFISLITNFRILATHLYKRALESGNRL